MKKLLTLLFISVFLISFASAFEWDNVLSEGNINPNTGYPSLEIKNALGLGETLFEGSLTEHTAVCGESCSSKFEFNHNGGVLIQDIEFRTILDDGSYILQPVRSYTLKYEAELPEYETQCEKLYDEINGSYYQQCSQVLTGETYTGWKYYNVGESLPAGTYEMYLEAEKKPTRSVDWVVTIEGKKLTQWAVWGGTPTYYSHGVSLSQGAATQKLQGIVINTSETFVINNFTIKDYNDNTIYGRIRDASDNSVLVEGVVSGDFVVFEGGYTLIVGKSYVLETQSNSDTLTYYQTNALSSPIVNGSITFESGWYESSISNHAYTVTGLNGYVPQAVVILNSPTDASTSDSNLVTFNATATISGGAYLTNMSLYTNETGSWAIRNTTTSFTNPTSSYNFSAYYKLDETTGSIAEDYTGSYNGTINDATKNQAGIIGTSYFFDGVNDYIVADSPITGDTSVSASFWFKTNVTTGEDAEFISFNNNGGGSGATGFAVGIQSGADGYAAILIEGVAWGTGTTVVNDNAWHHAVITRNGNDYNLYIDGDSTPAATLSNSGGTFSNKTVIGGGSYNGINERRSYIDEISIWDRILTTGEVSELYNSGSGYRPIITTASTETWNRTITDGIIWNVQACDSDGDCGFATSNYSLSIDTTAPTVVVNSPTGNINYGANGLNTTLNYTVTDTNLDSCWYNYNGTNITAPCTSGQTNVTYFTIANGDTDLTFYANDTIGNVNVTTVDWDYLIFENSQTYSATTVETAQETFLVNITYPSSSYSVITADLYYNETSYSGTKSGSGNTVQFSRLLTIPSIDDNENVTFYWRFGLTNASGTTYVNSTSNNQTISIINMSLCGAPHTVPFINFTAYDETTLNELNISFKATFTYAAEGSTAENTMSYSDTSENNSQFDFCMDPSTYDYTLDTNIEVSATGYVTKFFNWQSLAITNTTTEKALYMLEENSSTSYIIEVLDYGADPLVGAEVEVQLFSVATGTWITSEVVTTNDEGKAIGHLYSEDVQYRFRVYQEGVSVYNSSATLIICEETPCTVQLIVPGDLSYLDDIEDVTTTLVYSSATNIFTFTYSDTSGLFSSSKLTVNRFDASDASNNEQVCSQTSTSTSAIITCDISAEVNGTYVARGYIYRSDTGENLVEVLYAVLGDSIYNKIGIEGVLWAFFLFIGVVMIGVAKPMLGVLMAVVGIVFLSLLNIVAIGVTAVVSIIAIGVILLVQMRR